MAADRPRPARRTPAGAARGAAVVVVLLAAGLLLAGAPPAPEPAAPEPPLPGAGTGVEVTGGESEPGAVALLARADRAARRLAYEGTQVVARWPGTPTSTGPSTATTTALLDVRHEPGRGSVVRPVSGLPAPHAAAGSDAPESVVPDPTRSATGADGLAQPAAAGAPVALLERHYVLRRAADATTAGRSAAVVEAVRRSPGAGVGAARFWLDRETGLVLRREVVDAAGRTVLASAFLDLRPAVPAPGRSRDAASDPAASDPGEAVPGPDALEPATVADLQAEGWAVPAALGGLDLHEARAGGEAADRLVHLAYSDGLVSVSVFQQPGDLDAAALAGWERRRVGPADVWVLDGLPQRVAWASGGTVHTVLADGPAGTVEAAVAGLPHEGEAGGPRGAWESARERLARGLARLGAWVEPSRP